MKMLSFRQALNEALHQEMARDTSVFVYGLDVADHKRIFGSTAGLVEEFGPKRCFVTPISEDAMTGMGLGAALCGLRPVHVHIRVDFMLLAMNQLANMISTCRYMSRGRLAAPLTIRAVIGRGWGQSCQHSKSMHSIFAHIPGLKVVLPTTPRDAKALLAGAIRDNNPVMFLEHRWLYDIVDSVPEGELIEPLGHSHVLREGSDVTVIAVSWMNVEALKAAQILKDRHGVELHILDPSTIQPLDVESLVQAVRRTGRLIIADYDWTFCGFSAEVAALAAEHCFSELKAPIRRLGFAHTPCPTTRSLENAFYPAAPEIIRTVEDMLNLPPADLSGEKFYSYEQMFKGPF